MMVTDTDIKNIGIILRNKNKPLKQRFRALFTLRNLGGRASVEEISSAFSDPSCLLKHELAYCLGQMGDANAIPILIKVLEDTSQEPMVRHEAGEALGAIGCKSVEPTLKHFINDPVVEVAETCQIALARIQWLNSEESKNDFILKDSFQSVDPAPPSYEYSLNLLEKTLLDESLNLFERYRALFSLRNVNTPESAKILAKAFRCSSALFKHEVAFVLGQMALDNVVQELGEVVKNKKENEMVRHEAAEALGSIATEDANTILRDYLNDDCIVVKESCEVALDISNYENSSEFQYANGLLNKDV